ncbi:MAG TPA: trypsin-like peptidase domain-containing protein, partial [bacterium]|nr:trypsin-like peptidase domain-containing protein [bacterium]
QPLPAGVASTDPATAAPRLANIPAATALPESVAGAGILGTGGTAAMDAEENIITSVYRKAVPWVVHIHTTTVSRTIFGLQEGHGSGSGVIINKAGYILTNNHVIAGAQAMNVTIRTGGEVRDYPATLQGTDKDTDLAVIKITNPPSNLPVAELGDSDALREGQRAIVIGNPYGLDSSISVGVISALQRTVNISEHVKFEGMIQTDAAVNPGNSGGPLLNSAGQVVGINTVIFSQSGGSQGLGFAIPINFAKKVVADLVQYGRVRRPYLGVHGLLPLGPALARYLNLGVSSGVLIQEVVPGGPAERAGLQGGDQPVQLDRGYYIVAGGDVIISINGQRVASGEEVISIIRKMDVDDMVTMEIYRNGKVIQKQVKLAVQ